MAEINKLEKAKAVFATFCSKLDRLNMKYQKDEESLKIELIINGENAPMIFDTYIDADMSRILMLSPSPL